MKTIPEIADAYSFPLSISTTTRYHLHAFFIATFLVHIVNAAIQHKSKKGYWAFILILEGPVMLANVFCASYFQQWWARKKEFAVDDETSSKIFLWSYGR
jgi:hypothetical protein